MSPIEITWNQKRHTLTLDPSVSVATLSDFQETALNATQYSDAIYDALMHPVNYPPVTGGIVPGDVVAIVIDADLPNPDVAVKGVLRTLENLELSRTDVIVAETANDATRQLIRGVLGEEIELTVHSGKSRDDLRYLAANEAADPIYLNRRVIDADLVIPVFPARQSDPFMTSSAYCPVFPSLADYRSQGRARIDEGDIDAVVHGRKLAADDEATRVGWLLGLQWLVSVAVTTDGKPASVTVGTSDTLASQHNDERDADAVTSADIVVACIVGASQQHSIENVLRSALIARSYAGPESSIVLVTDLEDLGVIDEYAGESYDEDDSYEGAVDEPVDRTAPVEEVVVLSARDHARKLLRLLVNDIDNQQRYLLLSNGSEEATESFGFGHIKDIAALMRLLNGCDSCLVIHNAQRAVDRVKTHSR